MDESSYPPFLWEKPEPLPEPPATVEPEPVEWDESTSVADEVIAIVKDYVEAFPLQAERVLADEQANQFRTTLIAWLEDFISTRDTE